MTQTGIRLEYTEDDTIGPDKITIDPEDLLNQTVSIGIGTAIGMAINKTLKK